MGQPTSGKCHEVYDESCKAPANGSARTSATCFVCGDFVCTSEGCSTKMPWYKYGVVRVCRGCRESAERMSTLKNDAMTKTKTRVPFTIAMREALIAARNTLGISQAELAVNRCGLKTLGTLSGLERGRIHSIESSLLAKLEAVLGVKFNVPIGKPAKRDRNSWSAARTERLVDEQLPKRSRPTEAEVSAYATQNAMEVIAGQMTVGELARLAGCTVRDIVERVM